MGEAGGTRRGAEAQKGRGWALTWQSQLVAIGGISPKDLPRLVVDVLELAIG